MKKTGAKILVNSITMTRVIGTFLMPFVSSAFTAEKLTCYIILLLLTDSIDGIMARRLKVSTLFGALLDTIADKLLSIATLIILAKIYPIMWLPLITEILITLINVIFGTKGAHVESSMFGKIKTWVLGVCTVFGFITVFADDFINLFDNTTTIGSCLINMFKGLGKHSKLVITILAIISSLTSLIVALHYLLKNKKDIFENQKNGFYTKKYQIKKGAELKEALFDTDNYEKYKSESIFVKLGRVVD